MYLLIAGLGAYSLLKQESGLHQVDRRYKERTPRTGREAMREDRELVRVEVHPIGGEPSKQFRQQVKVKLAALRPPRSRLQEKADIALSLFHEPSLRSTEFWTAGPKEMALDRGLMVLWAETEDRDRQPVTDAIIRQYDLGLAPKVKDRRTGRTTTRVDQLFKGYLAQLLLTPEQGVE